MEKAFVDDLTTSQLLANWVALEASVQKGARSLPAGSVALVSLEGLVASPAEHMTELLCWLGQCTAGAHLGAAEVETHFETDFAADDDGPTAWKELPAAATWLSAVKPSPSRAYATMYIERLRGDAEHAAAHAIVVAQYAARVAALSGYGAPSTLTLRRRAAPRCAPRRASTHAAPRRPPRVGASLRPTV